MLKVFIHRPVLAMVISIMITVAGLLAMRSLPISQFPDITPPTVVVTASYPGADARTVEEAVAAPIEQQVNGAQGMMYMQSKSTNDGAYTLTVTFEVGMDPNLCAVDVQNRVNLANPFLPSDVTQNGVTIKKQSSQVLMFLALNSPDGRYDRLYLSNFAAISLVDQLARVKGVGETTLAGGRQDYAMRIWVKPDVLAKLGITSADLEAALREQNLQASGGSVGAEPMPYPTDFQYSVNVKGRLTEVSEFENIVVRSNPNGSVVRLKDVARIELGAQSYSTFGRFQGKPAIAIGIFQLPGANALETAQGVRKRLEELSATFPPGITCEVNLDTTAFVNVAIEEVVHTLRDAVILVLVVVYLFLGNWRATVVPMLAIPVSLVGTFAAFVALGFSINMLTLFGLILAVGIVVDDAIVVVEAVEHHIEHGMTPVAATERAMEEVAGPVVAIALVLISVFVPVAFMGGVTGQLYKQFALTLAVSVGLSAIVALTLTPALCALLLRPRSGKTGPLTWFFNGFNRAFGWLTEGYVRSAALAIRYSLLTLALLGVFFWGAWRLQKTVPTSFLPNEDNGYVFLSVTLPDAASLKRTDAVCAELERIAASIPETQYVLTMGGFGLISGVSASNQATVVVRFKDWGERLKPGQTAAELAARIQKEVGRMPQAQVRVIEPPPIRGLGFAGGFTFELQDRSGRSLEELNQVAQEFLGQANKHPQLNRIYTFFTVNVPQIRLEIDRDKVKILGVSLSEVFRALQTNMGGLFVNQFNRFGRIWRVYLQAEADYRRNANDIGSVYVRGQANQMVPLRTLLKSKLVATTDSINRFNLFRTVEINGQAKEGASSGQAIAAMEELAKQLPQGFGYEWTGTALQEKISSGQQGAIFAMAFLFVFLFLAALYESWAVPFAVLLGIPVGVVGAYLGVIGAKMDNNVYVQIGMVMLIGLAAKNAILIVEFAQMRVREGMGVVDAALDAARLRFRPILMTSFAFILGVIPLILAQGAGSISRKALGSTVFGGMLAASVLGIFFIPTLYVVVQSLADRLTGKKRDGGKKAPAKTEPPVVHTEAEAE